METEQKHTPWNDSEVQRFAFYFASRFAKKFVNDGVSYQEVIDDFNEWKSLPRQEGKGIPSPDLESGIVEEMREALEGTLADLRFTVAMVGGLAYQKRVEKISFRIRDIEAILSKLTPITKS